MLYCTPVGGASKGSPFSDESGEPSVLMPTIPTNETFKVDYTTREVPTDRVGGLSVHSVVEAGDGVGGARKVLQAVWRRAHGAGALDLGALGGTQR